MSTVKFLGVIIILRHILPKLSSLSRAFQHGTVNLSGIGPAIQYTSDSLQNIAESREPIKESETELKEGGRYETLEINLTDHQERNWKTL